MEDAVTPFNQLNYELERSIKRSLKKHGKKDFGYSASPTLTTDGSRVLTWRAILLSKSRKVTKSDLLRKHIEAINAEVQAINNMDLNQVYKELRIEIHH